MIENRDTRLPLPRGPYNFENLFIKDPAQEARRLRKIGTILAGSGLLTFAGSILALKYAPHAIGGPVGAFGTTLSMIPLAGSPGYLMEASLIKKPKNPNEERKRNQTLGTVYQFKWPKEITEGMRNSCSPQIKVYP